MKKTLCILLSTILMLSLVGCGSSSENSKSNDNSLEPITLTLAHAHSSGPIYDAAKLFKEGVEKDSNGSIIIDIKDGGVMGSEKATIDQLRMGAIEMALVGGASHQDIEPKTSIEELPYAFKDSEQANAAMDGEVGETLKELLEEKGITVLAWWENGFRQMTNNDKPIYKPADMKGLKIRSAEVQMRLDMFKLLEVNAIPIAFTELFTALQQGTVDGQENPESIIYTSKLYEVQNFMSLTGHIWGSYAFDVSKIVWEDLTDEQKQIISSNAIKARDAERQMIQDKTFEYRELLKEKGMQINEVNDINEFREIVAPIYDEYSDVFGKDLMEKLYKYIK